MKNKRYLKIGIFGFFSFLSLLSLSNVVYARGYGGYGGYGGWGMGPGMMGYWGMGWWGFIPMLLFWGVIIAAVVLLIKWLAQGSGRNRSGFTSDSRALETLKERFARGEITKGEFEEMKKVISG